MSIIVLLFLLPLALLAIALYGVYDAKNMIKEQKAKISSLSDRIERLSKKVEALENTKKEIRHTDTEIAAEEVLATEAKALPPVYIPAAHKPSYVSEDISAEHESGEPDPMAAENDRQQGGMERLIGGNLLSKIGILILVIGVGFFVKYAIDKDWITETGRTVMGILAGFTLWGIAYRIRDAYRYFSSVLAGGGFAVEFVTVGLAYNYYSLFPSWVAFSILIAVTALMTFASLRLNRRELALIATAGGFIAPFLAGSSDGSFITLSCYMLILDMGMAVLAIRRNWHMITMSCIALTYPILLIAHFSSITNTEASGALFSSLYFLIFSAVMTISIRNSIKCGIQSTWLLAFTVINDIAFFCTGYFFFAEDKTLTAFRSIVPFAISVISFAVRLIFLRDGTRFNTLKGLPTNIAIEGRHSLAHSRLLYGWAGILFFIVGCATFLYQHYTAGVAYMAFTGILTITLTAVLSVSRTGMNAARLFPGICTALYTFQTICHASGGTSLILLAVNSVILLLLMTVFLKRYRTGKADDRHISRFSIFYVNVCISIAVPAAAYLILEGTGMEKWWNTWFSLTVAAVATLQMIAGMRLKIKNLRMLALLSYAVIVAKLLLNDVWSMPPVSRIIVFIILGVLLLAVSFLYQKLKDSLFKADDDV